MEFGNFFASSKDCSKGKTSSVTIFTPVSFSSPSIRAKRLGCLKVLNLLKQLEAKGVFAV